MKLTTISIFILLAASAFAYTDADLKYVSDETLTSQNFDTISASYGDQGKDVLLTVYSADGSELENKYVGLIYSDKDLKNHILISPDPAGKLFPIGFPNYQIENNYIHTNLDLSTSDAVYPGVIYAVVSNDNIISSDDSLIHINPAKSWLIGADGGPPCMPFGNQWIIEGNAFCPLVGSVSEEYECPCGEDDADLLYDSYDISTEIQGNEIKVKVLKAYWKNNDGYAVEITRDFERIVVEARDSETGQSLDSAITSLYDLTNGPDVDDSNDEVTLSAQTSENVALYVNGIKTSEVTVEQVEAPTPGTGGGGGSSEAAKTTPSPSEGADNRVLTFKFDRFSILEINVYLKEPMGEALLKLKRTSEEIQGRIYEHLITTTNIKEPNLVYVKFRVPLQWLTENGLGREDIRLNFFSDNRWNAAQTSIISEDVNYVYYVSTLNEVSDFAIGDTTKTAREEAPTPVAKPPVIELEPVTEEPSIASERVTFRNLSLIFVLVLVALILLIIKLKKRKKII